MRVTRPSHHQLECYNLPLRHVLEPRISICTIILGSKFAFSLGIHLRPPIARQVYPRQESSIRHLHTNMDPVAAATNTATARGLPIEILLRVFSHLAPDACSIVLGGRQRDS